MYRLSRIVMVNWYLFEAEEWELRGNVALLGKNGTGKSSFIDAMQLVMLGGHGTDWHPNAKASDYKRTRDIRGYILGLVKDEEAVGDNALYQPRESALCRLAMVFENESTGKTVSIGTALSARRSESKEQVEGFFILKDKHLRLADFIQDNIPLTYDVIKAKFRNELDESQYFLFGREPGHFVDQLLTTLGPKDRRPALSKYRRTFRQSINLSGLEGSVSDFVKHSILEDNPLKLDAMRESMASYHNKKDAVARAKLQISELESINKHFNRAKSHGERRAGYGWCEQEFRYVSHIEKIDDLKQDMDDQLKEFILAKRQYREAKKDSQRLQIELSEVNNTLNQDDSKTRRDHLQSRMDEQQRECNRLIEQCNRLRQQLLKTNDLLQYSDILTPTTTESLNTLSQYLNDGPLGWLSDPASLDNLLSRLATELIHESEQIQQSRTDQEIETRRVKEELVDIESKLERLNRGQSNLKHSTDSLIQALDEAGIAATPICELVEVSEPYWQPAIEAFLRGNMEALIVPPEKAKQAVDIYRKMKKGIAEGAVLVNTAKVQNWSVDIKPGTAAELIEGDDSLAVTYVQRLLSGIELVESTQDLMKSSRALSPDGMFANQGGLKRLHLPESPKLGKMAREAQIDVLNKRAGILVDEMMTMHIRYEMFKNSGAVLNQLNYPVSEAPSMLNNNHQQIQIRQEMKHIDAQIAAIDTRHLDELFRRKSTLEIRLDDLAGMRDDSSGAASAAKTNFKRTQAEVKNLQAIIPEIKEARKAVTEDEDYNAQRAMELYSQLEEEGALDPVQYSHVISTVLPRRIEEARRQQNNEQDQAQSLLGEFRTKYQQDLGFNNPVSMAGYRVLVDELLHDIKDIGLHEREQEVVDALRHVQQVIRQDLAIKLRSNIEQMEQRMSELNRELRARPFSGNQIYQFHYERLPEFRDFLKYVDIANEQVAANTNSLFDEHAHVDDYIQAILDEDESDCLADYRNYYRFDITIKDLESGIEEQLSRRMGSASGGEHKSPYYVAMGASLASAYRIQWRDDGNHDGGLSLFLADEAFEKMDFDNTMAAFDYLKSIGLQMFVAAPDDAESRLRPLVDTVMFFIREGDVAEVEVDYVTSDARALIIEALHAGSTEDAEDAEETVEEGLVDA